MKIRSVTAFAIRIPRNMSEARGTAGSPAHLVAGTSAYRSAVSYQTLYSSMIETALIRIETDDGLIGWGEAQSPVAPEVVVSIVGTILGPLLLGEDPMAHERLWSRMYNAMRVRGHTGSFLLDAIAGIDTALWDIRGKALGARICDLLGGPFRDWLPAYISGLSGADPDARVDQAVDYQRRGFNAFKIFMDDEPGQVLDLHDRLRARLGGETAIMIDALWRLDPPAAVRFGRQLDDRRVGWFEAPLKPEDVAGHARLASAIDTPIAIGECWRTRWEMRPFFDAGGVEIYQPDIGRSGITEGMKLCALAELHNVEVAFHISIGLGVQIAAALHVAASIPNLRVVEFNPQVSNVASRLLKGDLPIGAGSLGLPSGPGLGIEIDEEALEPLITSRSGALPE